MNTIESLGAWNNQNLHDLLGAVLTALGTPDSADVEVTAGRAAGNVESITIRTAGKVFNIQVQDKADCGCTSNLNCRLVIIA